MDNSNRSLLGGFLDTRVRENNILVVVSRVVPGWRHNSNHSSSARNGRIVVVWNPSVSLVTYLKLIN